MKVRVARRAGFCWGVRRAVDAALETSVRYGHQGKVQTLGPLIHNSQALDHLSRRGIQEVASATTVEDGSVVIRAHGVPVEELRLLRARRSLQITNATCPEVARVQSIIRRHASRGGFTIILGQPFHAEVVAHRSYATSGCAVIESLKEAEALPYADLENALVVAQTTFSISDFRAITTLLQTRNPNLRVRDTICRDTSLRQNEAEKLVAEVGAVVVVGGRTSNNTRHLFEVAKASGKPTQWVECAMDLDLTAFQNITEVGVLAGASTPTWTVDEVVETLDQAERSSWLRTVHRASQTLQLPIAIEIAILTVILHRLLGWHLGWAGLMLPSAFHVGLSATLPFLDPFGLDIKGQLNGRFLTKYRRILMSVGSLANLAAFLAAVRQGQIVLGGAGILASTAILYTRLQRRGFANTLRGVPALKDLGQAVAPALLAVFLPWLQSQSVRCGDLMPGFIGLFSLMLATHSLRHLRAFHENRILGREILSVAIGSQATRLLAIALLTIGAGVLGWMNIR